MRRAAIAALVLLVAGCATVEMSGGDAAGVASDALDAARIDVTEVRSGADATAEGWPVVARVDGEDLVLTVDRSSGSISLIDVPEGVDVDDDQLEALASHRDNPADRSARRTRGFVAAVLVLAGLAGGLLLAHRARLREEASGADRPSD